MSNEIVIDIASDFSKYPSGRTSGKFSGTNFRKEHLLPKLNSNKKVIVKLDGILMRGSSFFEEAFGGLIRVEGLKLEEIQEKLELRYDAKPSFVDQIWKYIKEADRARSASRK